MKPSTFRPAWWLPSAHLQTIWPALMRRQPRVISQLEHERLELPDGDFLDLAWVGRTESGPIVLVLHGFEGSLHSHYIAGMLNALKRSGLRSVFMHFRGCSGVPNRLLRGYHSGETGDVAWVTQVLKAREPNTPIAAIGYSLGGNVLLKWLGETGAANPLTAAVAVSVPFELMGAVKRIQRGFSRLYQRYLLYYACKRLRHKFQKQQEHSQFAHRLKSVKNIVEFDNLLTAPLHGFKDAHHYYEEASSRRYLKHIETPTLILHAKDDPFMTDDVIPGITELSTSVQFEMSERGGHVGFVSGRYPWKAEYWLEQRVPHFFKEHFVEG